MNLRSGSGDSAVVTTTTNPETGSTVPPMPPAPNRQNRRRLRGKKAQQQQQPKNPEQELARLRVAIYNASLQSLGVAKTISEEARTDHPLRLEITESLRLLKDAVAETGLDVIRPICAQIRQLKSRAAASDTLGDETNS